MLQFYKSILKSDNNQAAPEHAKIFAVIRENVIVTGNHNLGIDALSQASRVIGSQVARTAVYREHHDVRLVLGDVFQNIVVVRVTGEINSWTGIDKHQVTHVRD